MLRWSRGKNTSLQLLQRRVLGIFASHHLERGGGTLVAVARAVVRIEVQHAALELAGLRVGLGARYFDHGERLEQAASLAIAGTKDLVVHPIHSNRPRVRPPARRRRAARR